MEGGNTMKLIFPSLILLCTLLIATYTIAEEEKIGRYQVIGISPAYIFLVDTAIGQVWFLDKKQKNGVILVKWSPIMFRKGFNLPGDNLLLVEKENSLHDPRLNKQNSVYEKAWKSIIENKK